MFLQFPGKIAKWGNSDSVRLRKEFMEAAGLKTGDSVMISVHDDGSIVIKKLEEK